LLYLSTLWFKDAGDGKRVSWHQDSAYYGLEPHDVVTLWLGFTDSNERNGCVQVIPGTHKEPDYVHVETYAADNLLARGQTIEEIDDSKA
ncbi:MAG: phytanoyl-CoA dioxygenase family protein, partial [Defluviicoccus sp.]|nr:phytanoyl-CoA dioxygenase family protein [Defluviicoccus sp.]